MLGRFVVSCNVIQRTRSQRRIMFFFVISIPYPANESVSVNDLTGKTVQLGHLLYGRRGIQTIVKLKQFSEDNPRS